MLQASKQHGVVPAGLIALWGLPGAVQDPCWRSGGWDGLRTTASTHLNPLTIPQVYYKHLDKASIRSQLA